MLQRSDASSRGSVRIDGTQNSHQLVTPDLVCPALRNDSASPRLSFASRRYGRSNASTPRRSWKRDLGGRYPPPLAVTIISFKISMALSRLKDPLILLVYPDRQLSARRYEDKYGCAAQRSPKATQKTGSAPANAKATTTAAAASAATTKNCANINGAHSTRTRPRELEMS